MIFVIRPAFSLRFPQCVSFGLGLNVSSCFHGQLVVMGVAIAFVLI